MPDRTYAYVTVTMPLALREAVEARADAEDRPMTYILRAALRHYLDGENSDQAGQGRRAQCSSSVT
jgi:predicted transcriptional regulator